MSVALYGIRNCDTVKRARAWLDAAERGYRFHDYKVDGVEHARLARWADAVGWEALLNRAGTTFRKLPEASKAALDRDRALALMVAHPSLIKRPVVEHGGELIVGFDPARFAAAFG